MIRTWGHGPERALFLHGFTGSARSFDHLEPLLGDVLTATCVDLPGHRDAPPARTFEEAVEGLAAALTEPTTLVGYSQGARLALAVALRRPEAVQRLVLESGSAGLAPPARLLRRQQDVALARELVQGGLAAFLERWESNPVLAGLRGLDPASAAALRARREEHTAVGLASAVLSLGQGAMPDLGRHLRALQRPVLVLCGGLDEKYVALTEALARELPRCRRVVLPGVGHTPHLECPREYAHEVRAFLAPSWSHEPRLAVGSS